MFFYEFQTIAVVDIHRGGTFITRAVDFYAHVKGIESNLKEVNYNSNLKSYL